MAAPEVPLVVDASPPQLQSFSITPQTVDTSSSSQTVTLQARITDDVSGAAGTGFTNGLPQVRFVSPSGNQSLWTSFGPQDRISGTPQDGVYQKTLTLPQYSEQDTWTVQSFWLVDMAGNNKPLTAADMQTAGLPTTFNNG